eukprot:7380075-Pyramimonas_sp.AAC.1
MVQEVKNCDAILVQETRLLEGRSGDAEAQLRSQGWRARSSPAVRSEPGGLSTGGLITMVRRCRGMAEVQDHQEAVVVDGRVHARWVSGVCGGGFLLANLSLEAGVGLNLSNMS